MTTSHSKWPTYPTTYASSHPFIPMKYFQIRDYTLYTEDTVMYYSCLHPAIFRKPTLPTIHSDWYLTTARVGEKTELGISTGNEHAVRKSEKARFIIVGLCTRVVPSTALCARKFNIAHA